MTHEVLAQLQQDHIEMADMHNLMDAAIKNYQQEKLGLDVAMWLDMLDYIKSYSECYHHPMEDALYQRLRGQLTAEQVNVLDKIELQHAHLQVLTKRLYHDIQAISCGQVICREKLINDVLAYLALSHEHMMIENRHLFPLLGRREYQTLLNDVAGIFDNNTDPLYALRRHDFSHLHDNIQEQARTEAASYSVM